jgi:hypothetical protein
MALDVKTTHQVALFPMAKRVGRIREVADKLLDKPTDRSAENYRRIVSDAVLTHLHRIGLDPEEQGRELGEFWKAVEAECGRVSNRQKPGAA